MKTITLSDSEIQAVRQMLEMALCSRGRAVAEAFVVLDRKFEMSVPIPQVPTLVQQTNAAGGEKSAEAA